MQRIPRLFVKKGAIVRSGPEGGWTPSIQGAEEVAAEARRRFKQADALYVVDLDGLSHGEANLETYQAMERAGVFPWLEAGFRKPEDVMDGFFAGAERVTIRLRDMHPKDLREVMEMSEGDVFLGVGVQPGGLEKTWRSKDIIEFVKGAGLAGCVLAEEGAVDAHRLETIAFELSRGGVTVALSPRPGAGTTVTPGQFAYVFDDAEVAR